MAKKWIKNTIVGVLVVVLIGGGTFTYKHFSKANENATTTTFRLVSVTKGNINQSVSGSGTVSSGAQYTLTAANAGTIDKMPVKLGDTIKSGSTVAHINETDSAQEVESNKNALQSAKDALEQGQQDVNSVYTKAPISGRIKNITVQSGDDLGTMRAVNNGVLCTISTDGKMKISINASGLQVNDKVKVKYNGTITTGTVTSTNGSNSSNSNKTGSGSDLDSNSNSGNVTVVINRDDWPVDASVSVLSSDGKILGSGTLEVNSPVSIEGANSGTVKSVLCSENQKVSKNTKLFKFDDSSVQSQIQKLKQQVTMAQNQLSASQEKADKDTVTTPTDGVVSELNVKNGDSVTAGESIATIVDPNKMQVIVSIDELDITKVEVGQDANIAIDALSGNNYTGKVTQIDSIGTASNGVTTYNVTVSIDNATDVKVGMNATATIVIKGKENVLTVPASAIQNISGTTGQVLLAAKYIDKDGKSVTLKNANISTLLSKEGKEVRLGFKNESTIEIVSGLTEGDQIAVPRTISKSMINSLKNTTTTQNAFGGMGGLGELTGQGGFNRRSFSGSGTNNSNRESTGNNNSSSGSTNGTSGGGNNNRSSGSGGNN